MTPITAARDSASSPVAIDLLGGLYLNGEFRSLGNPLALFVLLVTHANRSFPRDEVARMLWPDSAQKTARQSLRTALHHLRGRLSDAPEGPPVLTGGGAIALNPDYPLDADIHRFRHALHVDPHSAETPESRTEALRLLEQGLAAYGGPFLAGLETGQSTPFNDWLIQRRAWLREQALGLVTRLSAYYEAAGNFDAALQAVTAYLSREPEDDAGRRRLEELMARSPMRQGPGGPDLHASLEQRRIAVVYCQLPLPEADPSTGWLGEVATMRQACRRVLEQRGGRVEATPDGGMVAYFGQPPAPERPLRDACEAALAVVECPAVQSSEGDAPRIGLHTGWTLMEEHGHPDYSGRVVRGALNTALAGSEGHVAVPEGTRSHLPEPYTAEPATPESTVATLHRRWTGVRPRLWGDGPSWPPPCGAGGPLPGERGAA